MNEKTPARQGEGQFSDNRNDAHNVSGTSTDASVLDAALNYAPRGVGPDIDVGTNGNDVSLPSGLFAWRAANGGEWIYALSIADQARQTRGGVK